MISTFKKLKKFLNTIRSKLKLKIRQNYRWGARFLSKNLFEKVVIASYPWSGTTLLRRLIEDITKVTTGSDCYLKEKLDRNPKDEGSHNSYEWIFVYLALNLWIIMKYSLIILIIY